VRTHLKTLSFLSIFGVVAIFVSGCGGGGGGATVQPANQQNDSQSVTVSDTGGVVDEANTGARIIIPEGAFESTTEISLSEASDVPSVQSTVDQAGPSYILTTSESSVKAISFEIPTEKLTQSNRKAGRTALSQEDFPRVELYYYDTSSSSWWPLPTLYNAEDKKIVSYFYTTGANTASKIGNRSGDQRFDIITTYYLAYVIAQKSEQRKVCEKTAGAYFNGYYCQCPPETYWESDKTGCKPLGRLPEVNTPIFSANVGNASLGCSLEGFKLCAMASEQSIANTIAFLNPEIVFLQELITPGECLKVNSPNLFNSCYYNTRQINRLLNDDYIRYCDDQDDIGGAGYECIGVKKGLASTLKLKSLIRDSCNESTGASVFEATIGSAGQVQLINVHTASPVTDDPSGECRQKQIQKILNSINGKTLIAGDFNTTSKTNKDSCAQYGSGSIVTWAGGDKPRCELLNALKEPLVAHSNIYEATAFYNTFTLDYVISNFVSPANRTSCGTVNLSGDFDHKAMFCRETNLYPICGDGVVQYGESCDDGNTNSGDGCSAACSVEWACEYDCCSNNDCPDAGKNYCINGNTSSARCVECASDSQCSPSQACVNYQCKEKYSAALDRNSISPGASITMNVGDTRSFSVSYTNTGSVTWYRDGNNATHLGTTRDRDRKSPFRNSSWLNSNRASALAESSVAPGGKGTFVFTVTAPTTTGPYTESFAPVAENLAWMDAEPVTWSIQVNGNNASVSFYQSTKSSGGPWSTSVSGQQGTIFYCKGNGFTPYGEVARHIVGVNDNVDYGGSDLAAEGDGVVSWEYPSTCASIIQSYDIWLVDLRTGRQSNHSTETITASSSCDKPTFLQSVNGPNGPWQNAVTGIQGTTFYNRGTGFTPNGSVSSHIVGKRDGVDYGNSNLTAGNDGVVSWSWPSSCSSIVQTYDIWLVDSATGKSSTLSTETVTSSPACINPSLSVSTTSSDGPWYSIITGAQGNTFYYKGTGFTPYGTVVRHIVGQSDNVDYGGSSLSAGGNGVVTWTWPSSCASIVQEYDIWLLDSSSGNISNPVIETLNRSSNCN